MNIKSIRFKTIFVMLITITGFFLVMSLFANQYINEQFQKIENQKVEDNLSRVVDTYKLELENISTKLSDWSTWDDSYKFINDRNQEFIKSNLKPVTAQNLKLNFMIFVNNQAEIVAKDGEEIPNDLKAMIANKSVLITSGNIDEVKKGILNLKTGFLMFTSRPIITSEQKGPIRGSLIFAAYLDQAEVAKLSQVIHLTIKIVTYKEKLAENQDFIFGYSKISDFFGQPAFQFKIEYPRDITKQGLRTIKYFITIFIVSGIFFLTILILYLDKVLTGRIINLSDEINKIKNNVLDGHGIAIDSSGDEIAGLKRLLRDTFLALKNSNELEQKFKLAVDSSTNMIVITDEEGIITYVNEAAQNMTGYSFLEMKGKTPRLWGSLMPADFYKKLWKTIKEERKPFKSEMTNHRKNNEKYTVIATISPIINEKNKLIGFISTEEDINDQKKIQDDLIKKSNELERINKLMIGRELKMADLKKEISLLKGAEVNKDK